MFGSLPAGLAPYAVPPLTVVSTDSPILTGLQRWSGSAHVPVVPKRWSGSAYVDIPLKRWNGVAYVDA